MGKNSGFKLSAVALLVASSFQTQAALYRVIEVDTPSTLEEGSDGDYQSSYGTAIQASDADDGSCFTADTVGGVNCDAFVLGGETRIQEPFAGRPVDGFEYREEAFFGSSPSFYYAQDSDDSDYFQSFCSSRFGYATCDTWGDLFFDEWDRELSGDTTTNAYAFYTTDAGEISDGDTDSTAVLYNDNAATNVVWNSITSDVSGDSGLVGIEFSAGDERASVSAIAPTTPDSSTDDDGFDYSRAWKTDGTYTVGSVGYEQDNYYGTFYYTKAAIWDASGNVTTLYWNSNDEDFYGIEDNDDDNKLLAQASLRDFTITDDGNIYAVGFNTYDDDDYFQEATIFSVSEDDYATASNWTETRVSDARVDDDYDYYNTKLTGINSNLVAIGESKRGSLQNGAYPNRPFVVADASASSPSASYFGAKITASSAGGTASAINDYNEIVGQIDTNVTTREYNGKPRTKRGYIYPYDGTGSDSDRMDIFDNQAWLLDDLTNGGDYSDDNNAYRILDATGINNAGVISATAIKCSGGYDSTDEDATCGDGDQDETWVAVKLVPINGATADDISPRDESTTSVSRSGASTGLFALLSMGLLALVRRKRKA